MKTQFFLTRTGILAVNETSQAFFTNSGDFVRNCSADEAIYLRTICREIEFKDLLNFSDLGNWLVNSKVGSWHFLATIEVVCDESNFKAETSCNGGDYRFTSYHDWFCRNRNGKWEFAYIQWGTTSAEFSYDNINQQFQTDLVTLNLEDCENHNGYRVWGSRDADGFLEDQYQVVEKLATMASFEEMMVEDLEWIPSRYDDTDGDNYRTTVNPALTDEKKTEILATLQGLGWTPETVQHSRSRNGSLSKGRRN